jgi:hypothetical protein
VPANESVRCANPQTALAIFDQEANVVTLERGRIFFVEDGEVQTVKTRETFLCSDPEITILGLDDGLHGVLWQSVFREPRLVTKLFEMTVRI